MVDWLAGVAAPVIRETALVGVALSDASQS
jgi:hypothetical protein